MLIELSYMNGQCPLCGGKAGKITSIDSVNGDTNIKGKDPSYSYFVTFQCKCKQCLLSWYVQTYLYVGKDKSVFSVRRNLVDHQDFIRYKPLFIDMCDIRASLIQKEIENVQY